MIFSRRHLLAGSAAAVLPSVARAQEAPGITIVDPYPRGGSADFSAQLIREGLAAALKVGVEINYQPGKGGNPGHVVAAKAAPDGKTLLLAAGPLAVNQWLYKTLPFDPEQDFVPIGLAAVVPNVMVISATIPATSVQEFIAYAKARAGKVYYGSIGNGTSLHLSGAEFSHAAGLQMEHVPYLNTALVNTDLEAGKVHVVFQTAAVAADLVKSGHGRALAVTGSKRVHAFAELPTLKELGLEVYTTAWFGLAAPAGTPVAVLDRLADALKQAVESPTAIARAQAAGSIPHFLGRADFGAFIAEERARFREVVRLSGASVD